MLLARFAEAVASRPDRIAIVDGHGRSITFRDLWSRASAQAVSWKGAGLGAGDRALLAMPLGIDLYVSLAALWSLRAAAVLSEPATGLAGLRYAAATAAPKAILSKGFLYGLLRYVVPEVWRLPLHLRVGRTRPEPVGPASAGEADDAALVSFTSGSTGRPKVIVRSQGFLAAQDAALVGLLSHGDHDEGADLVAFPVFALANLGKGRTSVLPPWDVRQHAALDASRSSAFMAKHGVTRILAPPSSLGALLNAKAPPRLRTIITGGGPVFPDLVDRLSAWRPGVEVVSAYGSTEAEPIAHVSSGVPRPEGIGLYAGHVVPDARVRIVDDEIQVAGRHVVQGYLDPADDGSTKVRDGDTIWHRTGDAGRLDADGLWLLGRHGSDVAGLYPLPIEAEARIWPGVREAALGALDGRPVIAVVGVDDHETDWLRRSGRHGAVAILRLDSIPVDKRHGSKVDRRRLDEAIASAAKRVRFPD